MGLYVEGDKWGCIIEYNGSCKLQSQELGPPEHFSEIPIEPDLVVKKGIVWFEKELRSDIKFPWPLNNSLGYVTNPGWSSMSIGGAAEDKSKPGDGIIVSEEDRKRLIPNESVELVEYFPGRNFTVVLLVLTMFRPTNEKSEKF